jgi:hypothetical protein
MTTLYLYSVPLCSCEDCGAGQELLLATTTTEISPYNNATLLCTLLPDETCLLGRTEFYATCGMITSVSLIPQSEGFFDFSGMRAEAWENLDATMGTRFVLVDYQTLLNRSNYIFDLNDATFPRANGTRSLYFVS